MLGIFDSGSGGLSVLKAIRERAPTADVVYFGDLKNAPYGNKSREELGALTVLGIQKLIDEGAREIVSACNSVSVSIVLPMFDILNLPRASLIEMVGPTVASFRNTGARILVVATRATVASGIYQEGFSLVGAHADAVAIPGLVSLLEGGGDEDDMFEEIQRALMPYSGTEYTNVLLGCTHFPLVRHLFKDVLQELGIRAKLFDPAQPVADVAAARFITEGSGRLRFLVTEESDHFRNHIARQLGGVTHEIEVV